MKVTPTASRRVGRGEFERIVVAARLAPGDKLLLLALATHLDNDGTCRLAPSLRLLTEDVGARDERNVKRRIAELAARGWLEREPGASSRGHVRPYRLTVPVCCEPRKRGYTAPQKGEPDEREAGHSHKRIGGPGGPAIREERGAVHAERGATEREKAGHQRPPTVLDPPEPTLPATPAAVASDAAAGTEHDDVSIPTDSADARDQRELEAELEADRGRRAAAVRARRQRAGLAVDARQWSDRAQSDAVAELVGRGVDEARAWRELEAVAARPDTIAPGRLRQHGDQLAKQVRDERRQADRAEAERLAVAERREHVARAEQDRTRVEVELARLPDALRDELEARAREQLAADPALARLPRLPQRVVAQRMLELAGQLEAAQP